METLEAILAAHPFFKGLAPHYLQLAVGCAANVRIDPDQLICREGAEANEFYLIRDGRVALEFHVAWAGPARHSDLGTGRYPRLVLAVPAAPLAFRRTSGQTHPGDRP